MNIETLREKLKSCTIYEPLTGEWYNALRYDRYDEVTDTWKPAMDLTPMFNTSSEKYKSKRRIMTKFGISKPSTHWIWLYMVGRFPDTDKKMVIDHIDCNSLNDKFLNLREITHTQNCMNRHNNRKVVSQTLPMEDLKEIIKLTKSFLLRVKEEPLMREMFFDEISSIKEKAND